jgi:hypothetical protein
MENEEIDKPKLNSGQRTDGSHDAGSTFTPRSLAKRRGKRKDRENGIRKGG